MSCLIKVNKLKMSSMAISEIKSLLLMGDAGFGDNRRRVVNVIPVMVVQVIPKLMVGVENINKLLRRYSEI